MAVTVDDLRTLKHGDYIKASNSFYKVLGMNDYGILLSNPFSEGGKPHGEWYSEFEPTYETTREFSKRDYIHWDIIRLGSPEADGIEG